MSASRPAVRASAVGSIGLLVLGCATAPPGSPRDGEVRIGRLRVPATVRAGEPYVATFEEVTLADLRVALRHGCFVWHAVQWSDGPYCFPVRHHDRAAGAVTVSLLTRQPNQYRVSGFLLYSYQGQERKSNEVQASLAVRAAGSGSEPGGARIPEEARRDGRP